MLVLWLRPKDKGRENWTLLLPGQEMSDCSPERCRMSPLPWSSVSKDHRMIWDEKVFKAHLVLTLLPWTGTHSNTPGCSKPHPALNTPGMSKNLFQCLISLIVRNFCLISVLIPSFSLMTFPLVPPLYILAQCPSPAVLCPSGTRKCYKVSTEPSLFQAKQPKLFQPGTMRKTFQSSDHLPYPYPIPVPYP